MSLGDCPSEILDKIISDCAIDKLDLCNIMLTSQLFHSIARRHQYHAIQLSNHSQITGFAKHLGTICSNGVWPTGTVPPIRHLAMFGTYRRTWRFNDEQDEEYYGSSIEILRITAPLLHSLTLQCIGAPTSLVIQFPHLNELVLLDQDVISFEEPYELVEPVTYPNDSFPNVQRFYFQGIYYTSIPPKVLPSLNILRLDLLHPGYGEIPAHMDTKMLRRIIIDAPFYKPRILRGCKLTDQTMEQWQSVIQGYEEFTGAKGGVVVAPIQDDLVTSVDKVKKAWVDRMLGGEGCWAMSWGPTAIYAED